MKVHRSAAVHTALAGLVTIGLAGCGGSGAPTAPTGAPFPSFTLDTASGRARLRFGDDDFRAIDYQWCYTILVRQPVPGRLVTIRRVENTVIGPDGSIYYGSTDSHLTGQKLGGSGGGLVGCPHVYTDLDLSRPLATRYRMQVDFVMDDGLPPGALSLTSSGPLVSEVPPPPTTPQMTSLTIQHDLDDPQLIIRDRRPVTFTVTGTGGVEPYQFHWRLNNILLREWDTNPRLTWDTTLDGRPVFPGGYRLAVSGRSHGGREEEVVATLEFVVR